MYYDRLRDLDIKVTRRAGNEKTLCPQCSNSRKNKNDKCLSVNITTGEYNCHNCGWKGNVRSFERKREQKVYEKPSKDYLAAISLKERTEQYFREKRGISKETLEHFMIFSREEWMPQTTQKENCICFPYFRDGELVNIKFRDARKNFKMVAGAELIFYNLQSIGEKKKAIVTEGEIDCLSLYEAGFSKEGVDPLGEYAILSVPNGASKGNQRLDYLDNCADWFLGLEEVIIATDGDEAGKMLKDELVRRLGVERCRIVNYPDQSIVNVNGQITRPCKDLNEVLLFFGKEKVVDCVMASPSIPVEGIYFVEDIFGAMFDNFKRGIQLAPTTHFRELDQHFRWKKGEQNLFIGYGNHGKTTFAIQLMMVKSLYDGWKWGIFSPENYPANDFFDDMIEMYHGKSLSELKDEEYVQACEFLNDHFFYVYPEDSHDLLSIHDKFRYLILKKGLDGVLVDPFNQLDHLVKPYARDDQVLSECLKDTKRFALLNNISYNIVAHPKNPKYDDNKQLPVVDMYDVAGGAMWGNKMDQILSYYRPRFHEDKNSTEVQIHVQKVKRKRTGGKLGSVDMQFIWSKKRFIEGISEIFVCDPLRAASFKNGQLKEDYKPKIMDSYKPLNFYETDKQDNDIPF